VAHRRLLAALAAVYLIWGSTFLAIAIAIRTVPPLALSSLRYLLAGTIVLGVAWWREGAPRVSLRQLLDAGVVGFGLLAVGTGTIAWAEQRLHSGLAALLVATVPLWTVLLDRVVFGVRIGVATALGLAFGLGGVVLLVGGSAGKVDLLAAGAVVLSSLGWAGASLYARRRPLAGRPLTAAAWQMLLAGAVLGVGSAAFGEVPRIHPHAISPAAIGAFFYLVVVGSLVAYLAYLWLNANASPTVASTYAYVNPAVAVLLGWAALGESITGRTLLAGAAIVVAVVLSVGVRPLRARGTVHELPARVGEAAYDRAA
jgi:drug/metabolite transporter (DMT)-like permease